MILNPKVCLQQPTRSLDGHTPRSLMSLTRFYQSRCRLIRRPILEIMNWNLHVPYGCSRGTYHCSLYTISIPLLWISLIQLSHMPLSYVCMAVIQRATFVGQDNRQYLCNVIAVFLSLLLFHSFMFMFCIYILLISPLPYLSFHLCPLADLC